jgi:topoisomerase-4 subunit A
MDKNSDTKNNIVDIEFTDALGERYLAYALSTIMSRSLPDVRDGLKPVHRRLLYAMLQLKLGHKSSFKKSARIVGDVTGKYHPHGEAAVYGTLVRLAQDFTVRYPLIDGQGNFGSIDGDNPAAMRYTESRLTQIAEFLLQDLDKGTVDFRSNYDGHETEPTLLPASFPNLLANGAEGIAVGMASSIPPHNLHELCDGLMALIKNPDLTIAELVKLIPGPDLPTGGFIIDGAESILAAYSTGKGSFRVRARWHKEALSHGMYQVVITEIPYQVNKSKLIEKMADLFKDKKLLLVGNIRDESAEDLRIVLEPKNRSYDAEVLMESIFKLTDLESRVSLNMNVLSDGSLPKVMNLKEVLTEFLKHRHLIVQKRTSYVLAEINARLETLEGFIIAYLNLDEIIQIIREEDDAKQILCQKFNLSETQAEAILNMRLRSLRKLDEIAIQREHDKLSKEKEGLLAILNDDKICWKVINSEIKDIQKQFGYNAPLGARRTDFMVVTKTEHTLNIETLLPKEPLTIICTKMGWIRMLKGHNQETIKCKEGDEVRFHIQGYTTDKLVIFSKTGRFYTIAADKINKGKGHDGEPLRLIIDIENDDVLDMFIYEAELQFLLSTKSGKGFIIPSEEVVASTKAGKQILALKANDQAYLCQKICGNMVAIIGENRKLLVFPVSEIPVMRKGSGVQLQKYKDASLSDLLIFNLEDGFKWRSGAREKTERNVTAWLGKRASVGKMPPVGFARNNHFDAN